MVAPHVETPLTRSLVRVPNSGRDRNAGAVLHDLSRVSSAAAMVPITNYLALGLLSSALSPRPTPSSSPLNQTLLRKLASGTQLPVPRTAAARNGTVPRGNPGTNRPWSEPNPQVPTTSGATVSPRDAPHQSRTSRRVRLSEASTSSHPRGGRKRSLPGSVRDGGPVTTPKVPRDKTTTRNTLQQQQSHPTLSGGVVDLVRPRDPELMSLSNQGLHFQMRPIEGI